MNLFTILFLFLLYSSSIITHLYFSKREKYSYDYHVRYDSLVPRIVRPEGITNRLFDVPLTPLKSPYKKLEITKELPSFFLYKSKILTPLQLQGACGACWAFVTCKILSDRLSIMSNGIHRYNLSVQELLSCTNNKNGCYGGNPEDAFKWLEDHQFGLKPDFLIPYEQDKSLIISSVCPKNREGVSVKKNSIVSLTKFVKEIDYDKDILEENIVNMKKALINGGPFYSAITIYDDFYTFSGNGIYKSDKKNQLGGHAIEIIGYCDKDVDKRINYEGEGYWICRNTWSDWPPGVENKKGYFNILMGSNECGIESRSCQADPEIKDFNIFTITEDNIYTDFESFQNNNYIL